MERSSVWIVIAMIILVMGAFIVGTVVGFSTAVDTLSGGCKKVSCESIGIAVVNEGDTCEVCKRDGVKIVR